jgi:hypothetical protein
VFIKCCLLLLAALHFLLLCLGSHALR